MSYKISIIIPTYNRADFVIQTIQSVITQSFLDYEIIVVDDGSTDGTKNALKKYSNLPNFKYFYQKNSGRSIARNLGMERSSGEYLMFLDSDDLLDTEALKVLYDTFEKFPASDLIAGCRKFVDEKGNSLKVSDPIKVKREYFAEYINLEKIRELFFPPSSYIIKSQIAQDVGGFDSSMEPAEDLDFFIKCCDVCKISVVKKPVVFMRRHGGNTSEVPLRKASIKISQKNYDRINSHPQMYEKEILRKTSALWQLRIADDFYSLNQKKDASKHYWKSVKISPSVLGKAHVIKQIIASMLPKALSENIKSLISFLKNSKKHRKI